MKTYWTSENGLTDTWHIAGNNWKSIGSDAGSQTYRWKLLKKLRP